jgi:hypothetical protein
MSTSVHKNLMVVGTFRSGTNVMLETLKRNYFSAPAFNQYFWKHCLPPHCEEEQIKIDVGIICMIRNPIDWNRSIYKFWHVRRKELLPPLELSKFIKEPLIVYDNSKGLTGIRYHFNSPTDYWNKYYFAWAFWEKIREQLVFVRLEDFEMQTESVLKIIEEKFCLQRKPSWLASLPVQRVGPFVPESLSKLDTKLHASDEIFIESTCLADLKKMFNYP